MNLDAIRAHEERLTNVLRTAVEHVAMNMDAIRAH
jgi:hypothetical protein